MKVYVLKKGHNGFVGTGRRGGVILFDATLGYPGEGPTKESKKDVIIEKIRR